MSIQKYSDNYNNNANYNDNTYYNTNDTTNDTTTDTANINIINQQLHKIQLSYSTARIVIREQHIKISHSINSTHNKAYNKNTHNSKNYNQDTQQIKNNNNNYNQTKSNNYNQNKNNNYNQNKNNNYNKNKNYNQTTHKSNNYNQNKIEDSNDYKNNNKLVKKQYETVCILFKKPNGSQNCYCFYTSNNNNKVIQIDKYLYDDYKNEIDYFIRNLKRNIKENKFKLFDYLWSDIDTQFKNEIHNVITRYDINISNSKMITNINHLNELISRYSN